MSRFDPDTPGALFLYKMLSAAGGKDLKQAKLEELRARRKEFLESNEVLGGPPFRKQHVMESLIDMGLEEAEYMKNFEPDLLVVSREQYRELVGLSMAVPLNPDKADEIIPGADVQDLRSVQPPYYYTSSGHGVAVTFSDETDRMLLVESEQLSDTKHL